MKGKDDIKKVNVLEPGNSVSANPDTSTHSAPLLSPVTRSGPQLIRPEDMHKYMKNTSQRFFSGTVGNVSESDDDSFSSDESIRPHSK